MENIQTFIKKVLANKGKGITFGKIIKIALLAIVALLALAIILNLFKWVFGIGSNDYRRNSLGGIRDMLSEPTLIADYMNDHIGGFSEEPYFDKYERDFDEGFGGETASLTQAYSRSAKKMAPQALGMMLDQSAPYAVTESVSKDAEDFETREYSARYEEKNIDYVCSEFEALKPLKYVVFSNANKTETHCNYSFKVEKERENEVITLIKSLVPKNFNANTFTLERTITNNTNEIAILEKKVVMLDNLLTSAQAKYAKLRTTGNTNALVQAINNEISLIERITNQKLSVQTRIDRLTNNGSVQEERIDYSQFNVSVSERKFINWSTIGEQWQNAFERFISSLSAMMQDLTIGLMIFILTIVKAIVFVTVGVIALVATVKFLWATVKKIWRK